MAIEGGSGYRNNLIALAKLRANSKADPMAWTRVFVDDNYGGLDEQSKLLMRTINRMDKKGSLYTDENTDAIDSYFNMLDRAYGIEEVDPNTKKPIFKPGIGTALQGLMSPVAGERKIDLSSARGLEGLRSNVANERGGRVAGAAKREQRQGNDIIRTDGTLNWSKRSEDSTPAWDIIKAAGSEFWRDPQAFAQDMTLGILGSFSNIASDWAGADKNLLAEALKKRPELLGLISPLLVDDNVRGRTMALEQAGVLKPDAKPLDYLDAASWFLPGVGFAKPTQVATKAAMRAPKTVGAVGAGAGALAYTAMQPEEAEAISLTRLFSLGEKDAKAAIAKTGRSANYRARKALEASGGIFERISPAEYLRKYQEFVRSNPAAVEEIVNWEKGLSGAEEIKRKYGATIAHDNSVRGEGVGQHTADTVFFVPGKTNTAMDTRSFAQFVSDELKTGRYASVQELKDQWGLNHIPDSVLGII